MAGKELRMEDKKRIGEFTFRDAKIIWRNFEGRATDFNNKGDRNFNIVINPDDVDTMREDGWNIKERPPKREGDDMLYHLKVKVQYDSPYPPNVWLVTSGHKTKLNANNVKLVDTARIKRVDVTIRPYVYPPKPNRPEGGVTAYLKTMYITLQEDILDEMYANIPDTSFVNSVSDEELPFED